MNCISGLRNESQLLVLNYELSKMLTKTTSLSKTFDYLLITCCKIEGIDAGAIYLTDKITGGLRLASRYGFISKIPKCGLSYDFAAPESRLVMKGVPIYSRYPLENKEFCYPNETKNQDFCFICIIPVLYDDKILASLNFYSNSLKSLKDEVTLILESFAMRVGAIIARVNAVLALRESEERYRSLLETMNEGFLILDKNKKITYANNRICEMLGYRFDEILGLPIYYFLDEKNMSIFQRNTGCKNEFELFSYEISWNTSDGNNITTILAPKAIVDKDGIVEGVFAVITDITQIKEANKMLEDKERALIEKTENLQEVNTALKVLLEQREKDKYELEEKMLLNIRHLIYPVLDKIKTRQMDGSVRSLFEILESSLFNILSPFSKNLYSENLVLTSTEIEIANYIKGDKSTKEIAEVMNLSPRTIETHRFRIRKKLNLNNSKISLKTYLLSLK